MRNRRSSFAALGLLGLVLFNAGCDSAKNPVAPSGSVLTVTANPSRISLSGQTTITVVGFRPDGNPLSNGTQINLATDLGVLTQTVIEVTGSGRASTTLSGDGTPGMATVTASLPGSSSGGEGGAAAATAMVQIGESEGTTPTLSISASPNTLSLGESAQVTALARNSDGSLFGSGGSVNLRTDLGTLRSGFVGCSSSGSSSITVQTNSDSEARATLCVGDQPGTATITGSIGSSAEATASVTIENQKPTLIINANPDNITSDETSTITIIARDQNDVPLGEGFQIQLLSSFGTLIPENPVTNSESRATSTFDPDDNFGDAQIQALLGSSDTVSVMVTVRGDVESVDLLAPRSINRAEQDISLRARVLNARNEGIPSVLVTFSTTIDGEFQLPGTDTPTSDTVLTNSNGDAVVDLHVLLEDLPAPPSATFTVTVTVPRVLDDPASDTETIEVTGSGG